MRSLATLATVTFLLGCSSDSVPDARVASIVVDASPPDARPPDAAPIRDASAFIDSPMGGVACTYPLNAACNLDRQDASCQETDFGDGWVRQDVVNFDCPNGGAAAPCGGSATQPYTVSVIRLCRAGGANQMAPCSESNRPLTGPNGCAVCETTNLVCR